MPYLSLIWSRPYDLIGFQNSLLCQHHHVWMDGIEPITTRCWVRKLQCTHPLSIRRMQLQGPLLLINHGEVATQVTESQRDGLCFRPVGFHTIFLGRVLCTPAKVTEWRGFLKIRRHLSQIFHFEERKRKHRLGQGCSQHNSMTN